MRKHTNKLMAYALAGAMTLSSFGTLAIPMTAFAAAPDFDKNTLKDAVCTDIADNAGADNVETVTLGSKKELEVVATLTLDANPTTDDDVADMKAFDIDDVAITPPRNTCKDAVSVKIKSVDAAKTSDLVVVTATVSINGAYEGLKDTDTYVIDFPDKAGTAVAPYTITFTGVGAATSASVIGFVDDDGFDAKDNIFTLTSAGGNLSIGALNGGSKLTMTGIKTKAAATADQFYLEGTSSDDSIASVGLGAASVDTGGSEVNGYLPITTYKAGTVTLTIKLMQKAATGSDKTISTTLVTTKVVGSSARVKIYDKNKKNITGSNVELSDKESSATLTAEVEDTDAKFPSGATVDWFSSKPELVQVDGTNTGATIKAIGNASTAVTIYAVLSDDTAYNKALEEALKDTSDKTPKLTAVAKATKASSITVTSTGFGLSIVPEEAEVSVFEKKTSDAIVVKPNDNQMNISYVAGSAAEKVIEVSFETEDKEIATVGTDRKITGVKEGKTNILVTGKYKVRNKDTGALTDATVTTKIAVTVYNPDSKAAEEAQAKAAEELKKAQDAQKAAEEAATAAKADAAAQKTAAEAATKEAAAAKDAAAKAATAQKAAEDKAAAAEKKAADAAAAATGIKKGATKAVKGQTFKATSTSAVTLTKVKNAKTVTVKGAVVINKQGYLVTKLAKKALAAKKATTVNIDASNLTSVDKAAFQGTGKVKKVNVTGTTAKTKVGKAIKASAKKYNKGVKVTFK